jgi:toxin ParE1/3/4
MKQRSVIVSPRANADIASIYKQISQAAGRATADSYIDRLVSFLAGLDLASERGTLRNDLRQGLRVVGFEKRITIAFSIKPDQVRILRCFRGGQNWEDKV